MSALTTVCASEFILLDHHPDLSRRPEARPGRIDEENRLATLTWNVFRTLELIAPTFWLRRFRARLGAFTSLESGGRSLSVHYGLIFQLRLTAGVGSRSVWMFSWRLRPPSTEG